MVDWAAASCIFKMEADGGIATRSSQKQFSGSLSYICKHNLSVGVYMWILKSTFLNALTYEACAITKPGGGEKQVNFCIPHKSLFLHLG